MVNIYRRYNEIIERRAERGILSRSKLGKYRSTLELWQHNERRLDIMESKVSKGENE